MLEKRSKNGNIEYYVKWRGLTNRRNTWEPVNNLNCDALIKDFESKHGDKKPGVKKTNERALLNSKVKNRAPGPLKKSATKPKKGSIKQKSIEEESIEKKTIEEEPIEEEPIEEESIEEEVNCADDEESNVIEAPAVVRRYAGRILEAIIGVTRDESGYIEFIMKWEGVRHIDSIPAEEANILFSDEVITFYESRLKWERVRT